MRRILLALLLFAPSLSYAWDGAMYITVANNTAPTLVQHLVYKPEGEPAFLMFDPENKPPMAVTLGDGLILDYPKKVLSIDPLTVPPGQTGATGQSAYSIAVSNGFVGDEEEWLESLNGDEGLSAYQVAVENGFTGTPSQWLDSLVGRDGTDGQDGQSITGPAGSDGLSAYQIALANGFVGDEEAWLESLKGEQGDSIVGPQGPAGASIKGDKGDKGDYADVTINDVVTRAIDTNFTPSATRKTLMICSITTTTYGTLLISDAQAIGYLEYSVNSGATWKRANTIGTTLEGASVVIGLKHSNIYSAIGMIPEGALVRIRSVKSASGTGALSWAECQETLF